MLLSAVSQSSITTWYKVYTLSCHNYCYSTCSTYFYCPPQLIHGVHGLKPSEPVIDFITKYHIHFSGGVFWVNGSSPEFIRAAELLIQKVSINY